MEETGSILDCLKTRANKEDGDFYGSDGLLYCGKCKTRKERYLDIPDFSNPNAPKKRKVVACLCRCREEKIEQEKKEWEYKAQMMEIDRLKQNSLIESKLGNATLETFQKTQANEKLHRTAVKYIDNFSQMEEENQGLLFWGNVGTGKSFTAAVIANELLNRKITVIMTSFVKILQKVQDMDLDEAEYLKTLNSARLLIIDDLGTERNTDYALEKVYNVIDSRYRVKKPLILTTNLSLKEMQETEDIRYRRIYDRIFEMCYPVRAIGSSWREQEASRRFDKMQELMEG